MFGIASALDIFGNFDNVRVLNYMPLAHLFGVGTLLTTTYLGMINY
jgi:hypothetical protein